MVNAGAICNFRLYRVQADPASEISRTFQAFMWHTAVAARARLKASLGLTNAQLAGKADQVAQDREATAAAEAEAQAQRAAVCSITAHDAHYADGSDDLPILSAAPLSTEHGMA